VGFVVIDPSLLTATDFIGVRASLVKTLGNDGNRAIVLTRIYWRTTGVNRDAIERGGFWWWRVKYQTLAEETGLTLDQVKRVMKWLVENEYVETVEHRLDGITDRTLSIRVITDSAESHSRSVESHSDSAESHSQGSAESHSLPSIKKLRSKELLSEVETTPIISTLLNRLDDKIVANGSRRPARNKANVDAMRLLLERDKRSVEEIIVVIDWCQADGFWKSNILSAAALRKQYDKLRLRAVNVNVVSIATGRSKSEDILDRTRAMQEQINRMGMGQ
jgi:hypothetical protein